MTPETYRAMIEAQDGLCKICYDELDFNRHGAVTVDHDHSCCPGEKTCGRCLRGILCDSCNKGLGNFKDSRTLLLSAMRYLDGD